MLSALKKTIKRPDKVDSIEKEHVPISILMNENRQKILQFLFKYPCTHLHEIARNLDFSLNTTRWHLQKLKEIGYLDVHEIGNKKLYYPNNSLKELDKKILGVLNDKKFTQLYLEIKKTPGITQKELYSILEKKQSTIAENLEILEKHNLVYSQRDGRNRRYFITPLIRIRDKKNRKAMKEYRRILILLLKHDGVEPDILRSTDKKFHVRIKSGKTTSDLIFFFNPYERFIE
jgi:predicted transcriptional regulator